MCKIWTKNPNSLRKSVRKPQRGFFDSNCILACYTIAVTIRYITGLRELPYWSGYSKPRLLLHAVVTSKYFDLCIAGVIGLNVITMALEFYLMPEVRRYHEDHTQRKLIVKPHCSCQTGRQ